MYVITMLLAFILFVEAEFNGIGTTYGPPEGEPPNGGNCALMKWPSFAPEFHVAINNEQWNTGVHCGRCVEVQCIDPRCTTKEKVVGQITDRCPECKYGDLDMSQPMLFKATGYRTDRLAIKWDFVECPEILGGVQVCAKSGSSSYWLFVQASNAVNGVASMEINGAPAPLFDAAYYFKATRVGPPLSSTNVRLTNHNGKTIEATVALQADQCTQIDEQFPSGGAPIPAPAPPPRPSLQTKPPTPTKITPRPTTDTSGASSGIITGDGNIAASPVPAKPTEPTIVSEGTLESDDNIEVSPTPQQKVTEDKEGSLESNDNISVNPAPAKPTEATEVSNLLANSDDEKHVGSYVLYGLIGAVGIAAVVAVAVAVRAARRKWEEEKCRDVIPILNLQTDRHSIQIL